MLRTTKWLGLSAGIACWLLTSAWQSTVSGTEPSPIRDPEHRVQVRVSNWKELRYRNVVVQSRDYSCGAAALATVLRYYWGDSVAESDVLAALLTILSPDEMEDRFKNGLAISDLRRAAVTMDYQASIGTLSLEGLGAAHVPLVVPIRIKDHDHFVVYRGIADGRVYLADPIRGNVRPTVTEFCRQWQHHAILVVAKPNAALPDPSPLSIRCNEVLLGQTNDQCIRPLLPGRLSPLPAY